MKRIADDFVRLFQTDETFVKPMGIGTLGGQD